MLCFGRGKYPRVHIYMSSGVINMKWKNGGLLAATFAAAGALLFFPAQAAAGAKNGVSYSLEILVLLFTRFWCSRHLWWSGLSERIGVPLEGMTQRLFRLPGCCAVPVLMSVTGGFPAGARAVASLYEQGAVSARQAEQMLCFCVNAGPSFLVTAVGAGFLKSPAAGALLFGTQLTVFFLLGMISGTLGKRENGAPPAARRKAAPCPAPQALVDSAADGAASTLHLCCFVILFACLLNLLRIFVTAPLPSLFLSAVLEVTGGCSDLAKSGAPLWVIAGAVGWGGACVHFQVFAFTEKIPYRHSRFLLFRVLQGLLSGAAAFFLSSLFPKCVPAFAQTAGAVPAGLSGPAPASAALLLLCAALLLRVPRKKLEFSGRK